jgi:hypothetical protein
VHFGFFWKIKLVAAHLLQLSVASTLYTSLLHHLAAALHACHTALRYFPLTKPYLPSARCVFSFFFSSSMSGRQSQAAAAACVARSALLSLPLCFVAYCAARFLLCHYLPHASAAAAALLLACCCRRRAGAAPAIPRRRCR